MSEKKLVTVTVKLPAKVTRLSDAELETYTINDSKEECRWTAETLQFPIVQVAGPSEETVVAKLSEHVEYALESFTQTTPRHPRYRCLHRGGLVGI